MTLLRPGVSNSNFHGPNEDCKVTQGPHYDYPIGPHYDADATMVVPKP